MTVMERVWNQCHSMSDAVQAGACLLVLLRAIITMKKALWYGLFVIDRKPHWKTITEPKVHASVFEANAPASRIVSRAKGIEC